MLRELPDAAAHAVVTSPPYLDARPEYPSPTLPQFSAIFRELRRVVTGPALFNIGRIWRDHCELLWWVDLLRVASEKGNPHPAPMPLEVAEELVRFASWPGQAILDPFAGSGTTALAARRLGRRSVGIELSPEYASIAAERLSQLPLLTEGAA